MSLRPYVAVSALVVLLAAAAAAQTRPAADAAVNRAKLRLTVMTAAPSSVTAGSLIRVRGRVVSLPRRIAESGRLTFTLRTSRRGRLVRHLGGANLRRMRASTSRSFSVRVRIPSTVSPGRYTLRTCVRRGSGEAQASCRSKRIAVRARPPQANPPAGEPARPAEPARSGQPAQREARRPPQPARAGHRRELLLRHGRPLRERRHRQRPRRAAARHDRGHVGLRPDRQGLVPRRRPQGPDEPDRLHPGPRHDRDLADAELQEQGGAGQRGLPVGGLPRLLGHGLHPDRPASRHQRRPARARERRARARDEGLLRHHHQPHRGRHHVRGGRRPGLRVQGRGALPHGRRHAVRRPRLRRDEQLPGARPARELPVHAGQPAGRRDPRQPEPQGPRVAQRRHALPQPRQHDVHR